jgi:hypothetical protein
MGVWTEDAEDRGSSRVSLFRIEGRNEVRCYVGSLCPPAPEFAAPSVPLAMVLEGVTLPDGRGPLEAGARVLARAEALALAPGVPPEAWRSVPVRVKVEMEGCRPLEYDFRLDDPVVPRRMEYLEEGR